MTTAGAVDFRDVAEADVYIDDELAARLSRRPGDHIEFEYLHDTHPGKSGVRDRSVSWSLLRSGRYPKVTTGGAVPPFFAGLLPEGVRLGVLTSSTKTSPDDHFTLLLAIGADTVGNIRVYPAGAEPVQPPPFFDPETHDDFRAVFTRLTGAVDDDPIGLAGVPTRTACGSRLRPMTCCALSPMRNGEIPWRSTCTAGPIGCARPTSSTPEDDSVCASGQSPR